MQFGVSESVAHWGKYRPSVSAVFHNGRVASYRELNVLVDSVSKGIAPAVSVGERVAIAVRSKFDFLVALVAVLRVGGAPVLLNTGLPLTALETNVRDAAVRIVIHDGHYPGIVGLFATEAGGRQLDLIQILAQPSSPVPFQAPPARQPEDEWGVLYSSGTTGVPKGIERDHNSMITELLGWCLELGLTRETIFYIGRPVYYTGGLVLTLATFLVAGVVILNDYVADNAPEEVWLDYQMTAKDTSPSWAFFVPDQIRAFLNFAKRAAFPLSGSRSILVMGAPISGDEKRDATHALGSNVVESWGNSESLGTVTDIEDTEKRPNSIGRPFLTDELCVVDKDCNPVKPGDYGRIAGSQEAGFCRYCNRPEATDLAKRNELIVSEDIGYMDDDGYFYVCGRQQDCIIVNDETLFLPNIERKIRTHPQIGECCVVACEIQDMGVELIAVVVLQSEQASYDNEQLLADLNRVLTANECLNRVATTERMPRVASGKIDRAAAQELAKARA